MQREHVVMLAREDLVADLDDQLVAQVIQPSISMIGIGGGFFQYGVGRDHLARNQILANAEVLERTLCLCAPELVGRNIDFAETVGFLSDLAHFASSRYAQIFARCSTAAVSARTRRHSSASAVRDSP